ncbi:MAG: hypothetical protein AAGD07_06280 [Planctomycetota bacterium]
MGLAFVGLLQSMMALVPMMGGIRLTQTQELLLDFQSAVVGRIFYAALPVLVLGILSLVICSRTGKRDLRCRRFASMRHRSWWIPAMAVVVAIVGLFLFQPALYRAEQVDRLLVAEEFEAAFSLLEKKGMSAFPKQWDPVPSFPSEKDSNLIESTQDEEANQEPKTTQIGEGTD